MKNKIPLRTIKSDDCVIHIGREVNLETSEITNEGTPYYIHKGEWVKVIPLFSVRQYIAWNKLRNALTGDADNMERGLNTLCHELSNKVVEWNWTDNEGTPLEKPYKKPEVLMDLTEEELIWLSTALVETQQQAKNADAPSA